MATTQRGWPVILDASATTPLDAITGRALSGDVHTIFTFLCARYERLVEPIIKGHSWGWSYRPVRGYTDVWSEHAAGTAIDLNAPAHPMGRSGTFTPAQVQGIRQVLRECGGVVVWGGDWKTRPDEMHFELRHDPAGIARVAKLIRGEQSTPAPTPATPPTVIGTRQSASIVEWMTANGMDASHAARARLAAQHGITGYRGTAEQNLSLLSILRDLDGAKGKRYRITGASSLNVRTGPGIKHPRLGSAPKGTIITGTGKTSGGWIEGATPYMASHGQTGWWSGAEMTEVK